MRPRDPDIAEVDTDGPDWATRPTEAVPPWRRSDRQRVEQARALVTCETSERARAAAQAHEVHRLAELHLDGVLTSEEFLSAVRVCLAQVSESGNKR